MLEANKVKLGLFVTFSVVLFFCVIAALGVLDALQPRVRVMTLFKESVQGLESGSPVKFRGVPIGKVSNIIISAKEKLIRVEMDIDLDKLRTEAASGSPRKFTPQQFYAFLDSEIKSGLRCRLEFGGLTGLKYIEFDYQEPEEKVDEPLTKVGLASDGVYYMPSTASLLSGLRTNLSDTLSKIAAIDYKKIADEMTDSLSSVNKLFSDPRIREIIGHVDNVSGEVEKSAKNINATFTQERMDKLVTQITATVESLRSLSDKSRDALDAAQIGQTSASFREAVKAFIDSKSSFSETLMKFNETLDSFSEFIVYMDGDPSALIKGKRKAPALERYNEGRMLQQQLNEQKSQQ